MIEIVKPGIHASVQDLGRTGFRKYGIGLSGAMDPFALTVANHLLGNEPDAAAIECALGGIEIRFHADTCISLAGPNMAALLDDAPVPSWWATPVRAGQVLRTGMLPRGMRFYIGFAGGIDVEEVMSSRSTDLKGRFGGFEGRMLRHGDRLAVRDGSGSPVLRQAFGLAARAIPDLDDTPERETTIRFLAAAEWEDLAPESRRLFLDTGWSVDPESNRMGYRLSGACLELTRRREMLSHGILPGTIQLPPSGLPIIQLNDANTCGGYPKLGVVIAADMRRLAQARLRSTIRFRLVEREEAVGAARRQNELLQGIGRICRSRHASMMQDAPAPPVPQKEERNASARVD